MKLTGGKGVDVLYDNIANPKVLPKAFLAIGMDGRLVTAGAHAGPEVTVDFSHLYHKRITIKGQPGYHAARCAEVFRRRGRRQNQSRRSNGFCRCPRPPRPIAWSNRAHRRAKSCSTRRWDDPLRRWGPSAYIPATFRSSPMTASFAFEGGRSAEEIWLMTHAPLMPKATAVWLVENTALSFDQVADFCKLHPLEVKAIADGDAAQGIKGLDPILTGQLTREEIEKAEADPTHKLKLLDPKVRLPEAKRKQGPALHAGVAPPGPAERDPLAGAQSSRAQGQPDHAARRHHQVDHLGDPRAHPLERAEPPAHGPGDARPVLADRSRSRSAPRRQGEAGRRRGPGRHPAARLRDHDPSARASRRRRSPPTSSMSTRCSPSSSRSAASGRVANARRASRSQSSPRKRGPITTSLCNMGPRFRGDDRIESRVTARRRACGRANTARRRAARWRSR